MNRRMLIVTHPTREDAKAAGDHVAAELRAAGIEPVRPEELDGRDVELAIVLGGDGTILHTAEMVRERGIPIIGVNLGHVGFLAEMEVDGIPHVVARVVAGDYQVEERVTVDVTVARPDGSVAHGWAMNEASVEKTERSRMVEVAIGIDGRGVSSFGCDAVVLATPTGSTAYAFSGGGPIVWPNVEALLLVPISAHALFARPMVVGPNSRLAVEIVPRSSDGVVWCDGRRALDAPAGSHIEAVRGAHPVRIARLTDAPFSQRLVAKFALPVAGWRGEERRP